MQAEDKVVFDCGASRSEVKPGYHLIPGSSLRRLAERYAAGAAKHGESNWKRGKDSPEYRAQAYNHVMDHLHAWNDGDRSDDHLGAAAWGCMALLFFDEEDKKRPESLKDLPHPLLSEEDQAEIDLRFREMQEWRQEHMY